LGYRAFLAIEVPKDISYARYGKVNIPQQLAIARKAGRVIQKTIDLTQMLEANYDIVNVTPISERKWDHKFTHGLFPEIGNRTNEHVRDAIRIAIYGSHGIDWKPNVSQQVL